MLQKIAPILDESAIDWQPTDERIARLIDELKKGEDSHRPTFGRMVAAIAVGITSLLWLGLLGLLVLLPPEIWPW